MKDGLDALNMIVDKVFAYGPSRKNKKSGKAKKRSRTKKLKSKR